MQDVVIICEPAVEIAVTRCDAGIMLRLEGAFVDELLPYAVVRGEIYVFEKLSKTTEPDEDECE